jgi:4-hydroxy-3-polyprenylbenzoate decarboxylase
MLNNIDPERDVQVVTTEAPGGGAWVVDATPKGEAEGFTRPWPDKITMPDEITARMAELAERHGF